MPPTRRRPAYVAYYGESAGCTLAPRRASFDYSAESLRRFTETRHHAEINRYRPASSAPGVDRDFCLWAIRQLAPAILNDGAWLAAIAGPAEKLDEVQRYLLRIYVDELCRAS
jgi:hypothetical protein